MSEADPGSGCVGCGRVVRLAAGEVDRLLRVYFEHDRTATVADEPTYARRLGVCDTCPDLRFGTTCRHCGCLVAIRAKLADKHCPAPAARWPAVGDVATT